MEVSTSAVSTSAVGTTEVGTTVGFMRLTGSQGGAAGLVQHYWKRVRRDEHPMSPLQ